MKKTLTLILVLIVLLSVSAPALAKNGDSPLLNVALFGIDHQVENTEDAGRADCMMLCSINRDNGEIKLISFERAIEVDIPYHKRDLLCTAHHYGGPVFQQQVLQYYFNFDCDGYAEVNFETFAAVADILGGVNIELTAEEAAALNGELNDIYPDNTALAENHVTEGMNHLNGHDALMYCRLRCIDSDWERVERQRNFIQCILSGVKDANIFKLTRLAYVAFDQVETDISITEVLKLIGMLPKLKIDSIQQMTVPERTENISCNFEAEGMRIDAFLYGEGHPYHYENIWLGT